MSRHLPLLALLVWGSASAAPVRLDALAPPVRQADGRTRFAPEAVWDVRPAVIVEIDEGAAPPPGAVALGGPFWRVPAVDGVAEALGWLAAPGVRDAFPDVVLPAAPRSFDDPSYGGQWYLQDLGMELLLDHTLGDPDVRVAVIDTGIDLSHPDLAAAVVGPYDAYDDDDDPNPTDGETHGTSVAGISVARADNGVGIVGMCPACSLVPIRLLGSEGRPLSVTIAAFEHAIAQDAGVINNSWGYADHEAVPGLLADVIERARTVPRDGKGALVVFAAGNDDRELQDDEMEALPGVLCVSAIDTYGNPTNYTNRGPSVDLTAPSATVTIAPGGGVTETFGGTSAAAPVATGLAAWALSVDGDLTADELHDLLVETSEPSPVVDYGTDGHDDRFGYGNLSPHGVYEALVGPIAGEEEPRACGCGGSDGSVLGALLAALVLRRRR